MSGGTIDCVEIAAALGKAERKALLELPGNDAYGKLPPSDAATSLLLGHGIPLIVVVGDWAKRTRAGEQVCRELERARELAS